MNPVTIIKNKAVAAKDKFRLAVEEKYRTAAQTVRDAWVVAMKDENAHYVAAAGYIPFIGWLLPVYLKKDSSFCQEHGKAAFYIALVILTAVTSLMVFNIFVSREYRIVRLVLVSLIYLLYLLYIIFISYGLHTSLHRKAFGILEKIPVLNRMHTIIEI
ncbi:MAG TPA: hypothetical protein PK544_15590 [Spirochaetota bacterium]|nr:hypothetical protein [Spirochaetota bacterium]HPJ39128.1 hypothetical protein [Spirochaetota bacterium]HPQ54406.1 hypothetical protein [Spirochaetota bacterium]